MNSFKLNQYCTNYTAVNKWMIKMHCEVIMCIGKMSNISLNKSTSMYTCRIEINQKLFTGNFVAPKFHLKRIKTNDFIQRKIILVYTSGNNLFIINLEARTWVLYKY